MFLIGVVTSTRRLVCIVTFDFDDYYNLGCPPAQHASHHQDYYIFSRGSQPKPSFATVTRRGDNPNYNQLSLLSLLLSLLLQVLSLLLSII